MQAVDFAPCTGAPADINQNILPVSELNPWALPHMYQTAHVRPDSPV